MTHSDGMGREGGKAEAAPARTVVEPRPEPISPDLADEGGLLQVEVLGGSMDGLVHFSTGSALLLGRGEECGLVLAEDSRVSTRHAKLERREGLLWLEDLGSTNGTFLGSQRVNSPIPVAPGVCFTLGRTLVEILPDRPEV